MSQSSQSTLNKARMYAQYFTFTAAIISGMLWIFTAVFSSSKSAGLNSIRLIVSDAVVIGGIVMGTLYVIYLSRKKKA